MTDLSTKMRRIETKASWLFMSAFPLACSEGKMMRSVQGQIACSHLQNGTLLGLPANFTQKVGT